MVVLGGVAVSYERGTPVGLAFRGGGGGARPVHLIITMIKWIRTSRSSLSLGEEGGASDVADGMMPRVGMYAMKPWDPFE